MDFFQSTRLSSDLEKIVTTKIPTIKEDTPMDPLEKTRNDPPSAQNPRQDNNPLQQKQQNRQQNYPPQQQQQRGSQPGGGQAQPNVENIADQNKPRQNQEESSSEGSESAHDS